MKDMIKTVTVLCVISLIAGALLGLVNEITFISDEEILNSKLKTAYAAEAFTPVQTASEEGLLGVYSPDGADGVYVYYVTDEGYGGEIKLQRSELGDGGWFNKDNLPEIPEKLSIARRLIDDWLGTA